MSTITIRVSEQDKAFLQYMANFEGKTLSEIVREKALSTLEDEYDRRIADEAYTEYLADLENGIDPMTWEDMLEELGLADEAV